MGGREGGEEREARNKNPVERIAAVLRGGDYF